MNRFQFQLPVISIVSTVQLSLYYDRKLVLCLSNMGLGITTGRHGKTNASSTIEWCRFWSGGITRPLFLKSEQGHTISVNGDTW